jgi:hypothetical protein
VRRAVLVERVLLAVGVLAAIVPIFAARDLPLTDLPNHLGAIRIWHDYHDPRYGFARYYTLNLQPVPYWLHYGAVHLLTYLMPLRAASKLFLVVTLAGLPLAAAAFLRAHGRPVLLALAVCPFAWGFCTAYGFVAYLAGVDLVLVSWALMARLADARPWPSRRLVASVAALGVLLCLTHPIALLLWLVGLAVYAPRRLGTLGAAPVAFFLFQLVRAPSAGLAAERVHQIQAYFAAPGAAARELVASYLFQFVNTRELVAAFALFAVGVAAAAALIARAETLPDRRPLALLGALVIGYFLLPGTIVKPLIWSHIADRLPLVMVPAALAALPAGTLAGWRQLAVAAPLATLALWHPLHVAHRFARFDARAQPFYALVDALPYDPKVLVLEYDTWDGVQPFLPYAAWHSYIQVERGGYDPYAWPGGFPMRARRDVPDAPPGAADFRWEHDAAPYEWFVTRAEPKDLFAGRPVELVREGGGWKLWHRLAPDRPSRSSVDAR